MDSAVSTMLGVPANAVPYDPPKVFHIPNWGQLGDPGRVAVIRRICDQYARDPRIVELSWKILREAGIQARDYKGQARAILKWIHATIEYVNEAGERLQSPIYTLDRRVADCDDMAILYCSLAGAIALPTRLVLSGVDLATKEKVRWVEGQPQAPRSHRFSHIYASVRTNPYNPKAEWLFVEPTLKTVDIGWDVVGADSDKLPEMNLAGLMGLGSASAGSGGQVTTMLADTSGGKTINWQQVGLAVAAGVTVTVVSQIVLDLLRKNGIIRGEK